METTAFRTLRRALGVAALGLSVLVATAHADTRLRIAGQHAPDHNATVALKQIEKELEGAGVGLRVQLFPAGQLGTGEQVFGDVIKGSIDIAHTFVYSHNDPQLEINSIPYLVENYVQMRKVFTPGSNFYKTFAALLDKQGVRLLGIFGEGFIGAGTTKMPKDAKGVGAKGLNIRVWSARVAKETTQDIGYKTTTIDWGDAFAAIQQGVVDGLIGPTPEAAYTTFRDALKIFISYNAFVENTAYYMNKKSWAKLNDKQKAVVANAFSKAALGSFATSEKNDREFTAKLAGAGIEIVELSDAERKAIANHVRATTWPKFEKVFGKELLEALKADSM